MKGTSRIAMAALVILLAGAVPAFAHGHGGGHVSFWVGPVWGGPFWWGPGYYSPPPQTVIIDRSPEVYMQQSRYYCKDAKAYYPYVKQCPGGWQRVTPTPPPEEGE